MLWDNCQNIIQLLYLTLPRSVGCQIQSGCQNMYEMGGFLRKWLVLNVGASRYLNTRLTCLIEDCSCGSNRWQAANDSADISESGPELKGQFSQTWAFKDEEEVTVNFCMSIKTHYLQLSFTISEIQSSRWICCLLSSTYLCLFKKAPISCCQLFGKWYKTPLMFFWSSTTNYFLPFELLLLWQKLNQVI